MVSHKAKTLFHWSLQYYSKDLDGVSIAQKEGSGTIRKHVRYVYAREKSTNMNVLCVSKVGKRLQ